MSRFRDILDSLMATKKEAEDATRAGWRKDPYLDDPEAMAKYQEMDKKFHEAVSEHLANPEKVRSGEQVRALKISIVTTCMAVEGVIMASLMSGMDIGLSFPKDVETMQFTQRSVRRGTLAIVLSRYEKYRELVDGIPGTISRPTSLTVEFDVTDLIADVVQYCADARIRQKAFTDAISAIEKGDVLEPVSPEDLDGNGGEGGDEDGEGWKKG